MKSSLLRPERLWLRLRHLHIENKGLKLLALGLALLLFAISRQPISDVRLSGVQVEFTGISPGVEIMGEHEQKVSLRLRGPRDVVRSLTPNQLTVTADLSNKQPGERVVQLRPSDVTHPDGIRVLQIEPASIRLQLEPKVRKRIRVEAQFDGQPSAGQELYGVNVQPTEVEVEGPQSQLERVTRLVTETVSLQGHTSNFRTEVEVETPHPSMRVLTPSPIKVAIEIGERRISRYFANLPVVWLDPLPNGRLLTKTATVELYGPHSLLEALKPETLRVECQTAELSEMGDALPLHVVLPASPSQHVEIKQVIPTTAKIKR